MGSFFKKDVLVFWRDRKEILMALFLPIVLILVLNFAFAGLFNKDEESLNIDVAIVQEDMESIGLKQFAEAVELSDLPLMEKERMLEQAALLSPSRLILDLFSDPGLEQWVSSKEISEVEAVELVKNGELDAIIKIPQGFTYDVLSKVMLGEESDTRLMIQAEEQSTAVTILQEIITNYFYTLNLQFSLKTTDGIGMLDPVLPQGGREIVQEVESYSISQYFTIAMSALCALFMAQTVAMKTVTEKRERVFNRIILTGSHPLHYLMGKSFSTFFLTWIQLVLTFTIVQFILNVFPEQSVEFWIGTILVITAFALTVAGLSALFTAITLNLTNLDAASGIFTMIIMAFAILGGSFFPLQGFPDWIRAIGEWVPNGLTQTVLLEWIQFNHFPDLIVPILTLIVFCIVLIAASIAIFPKRGRV